jgi:hypothetical protein
MRMHLRTSLVLIAVLVLGLPAAAHASGSDVIRDCAQDGKLDKTYTQKELQDAQNNLPSDIDEYTDCRSVIRAAMHGGSGNPGGPGPAGAIVTPSGAVAASPQDVASLAALQKSAVGGQAAPVVIAGQTVTPGDAGLGGPLAGLAASNAMPTSLVVTIGLLISLAVVTAYLAARQKFPAVQRVASRIFRR